MALLVGFMYHLLHIEIIRLLKKKRLDPHFSVPEINELNIYKLDPSELPGLSEIKSDEQVWSFFCEPDYKYANSKRANRKTGSGNWKITGKPLKVKDKTGKVIGSKKNLVYHKRVASKMVKTDWLMYEFSVKDSSRYKVYWFLFLISHFWSLLNYCLWVFLIYALVMNLSIEHKSSSASFHLYILCFCING
ncbi:protein FEZ-like [Pistacia vera]|uniref:protein FEZ-like n=1 Tax=Pistacia vera TaxID=55513 RepID=UPI001263220D|nr:protein FEZ-like [Pistacia vera]